VLGSGLGVKELVIEHMRKPGQRVPVREVARREGPFDILPGKPRLNGRVFENIDVVVVVDRFVITDRPIHGEGRCDQTHTEKETHTLFQIIPHNLIIAYLSTDDTGAGV
jgi:hypothetical protein